MPLSARFTIWLLAVVYCFLALGISIPVVRVTTVAYERFPCEKCGCGCATAEQCWKSCCCFTPQQRLDWAERNGVVPPAGLVAVATCESKSCCGKSAPPTTSEAHATTRGVIAWRAVECNGVVFKWLTTTIAVVDLPVPCFDDALPRRDGSIPRPREFASRNDQPVPPPPRFC